MNKRDEFLKEQKILRLATVGKDGMPHIVPVWYKYQKGKIYVGTNTKTQKAKNVTQNTQISFCVDVGVHAPNIYGVLGQGTAELLTADKQKVKRIGRQILLRYFDEIDGNESAEELLDETDCIIQITPVKLTVWQY